MGLTNSSTRGGYSASPSRVSGPVEPDVCSRCEGKGSGSDPGNPGRFQDIHRKVKNLYPQNFEGATLTVNRILSNHFRVAHTITLSSITPAGYKFGAIYEGTTMIGKHERYPALSCTVTPSGKQAVKFLHTLGCRYRLLLEAQIAESKYEAWTSAIEYRSDNCTLSLGLDNLTVLDGHGTLALHFLQSVSSGLALGIEMACMRNAKVQKRILTGAARYSTGPLTVSVTLGEIGVHVSCHRRASQVLEIGAELEINDRTDESRGNILYRVKVPRADLTFRGMLDSEGTISALFDKKLSSLFESSLLISAALNHKKGNFRVGVGLNVG